MLGRVAEGDGWYSTKRYPDARQMDDVAVYRWDAPLFFANAGIFRQEVLKLVRTREPRWVVLQCEAITDVDVTAADMLEHLDNDLNTRGVNIAFVGLHGTVEDLLDRYGLFATLTRAHVYASMETALSGIEEESRATKTTRRPGD